MSSPVELANAGILMGIVHVLTGPDHLSALATLCGTDLRSSGRKRTWEGFLLGVRWGVGHSVGLLLVGGILIAATEASDEWVGMDDALRRSLESLVGVFMLGLGAYGMLKAFRNRAAALTQVQIQMAKVPSRESLQVTHLEMQTGQESSTEASSLKRAPSENRRGSVEIVAQMAEALNRDGDEMRVSADRDGSDVERRIRNAAESLRRNSFSMNDGDDDDLDELERDNGLVRSLQSPSLHSSASSKAALSRSFVKIMNADRPPMKASGLVHRMAAPENSMAAVASERAERAGRADAINERLQVLTSRCSPNALALAAGVVHGVAGPGGVLGVVPAVQLRDAKLASVYLGTFCATSVLVMGCFAASYGTFGEWLARGGGRSGANGRANRIFCVEFGSAFLSIAVGITWLILLSVGKLDDVFS